MAFTIKNGWLVEAQDGHYGAKSMSRNGYSNKYIVLHGTAGGASASAIDNYFTNGGVDASSHVIIGQDGTVIQGISFDLAAWGNGVITDGHAAWLPDASINPNFYTISIEHVKAATDNSNALTAAQQAASFAVIEAICNAYGIPKQAGNASGGIISHADIDPVNRSQCPGPYPWDALWSYLKGQGEQEVTISLSQVTQWYEESPAGVWLCKKTGKHIQGDILKFYQTYGGGALCGLTYLGYPLNEEYYPGGGGSKKQRKQDFERGTVAYDPDNMLDGPIGAGNVYTMHIEATQGYQSLQAKESADEAQIKSLQSTDATKQVTQLTADKASLTAQLNAANGKLADVKKIVG